MECNIGKFDRVLRRCIGLIIIGFGIYFKSYLGWIGILPILMSYVNYCPLYIPFNINTKKEETTND